MAARGVLRDDARLELIDGEIYEMAPIGARHASVVDRLNRLWTARLGTRAIVRIQGPVVTGPRTQLQPDVALLREMGDFYFARPVRAADVLLVNEVADQALGYDRAKLAIYATAGVPEVWLVDIDAGRVEVHRGPGEAGYRDVRIVRRGETVAATAFPDVALQVDEVLG